MLLLIFPLLLLLLLLRRSNGCPFPYLHSSPTPPCTPVCRPRLYHTYSSPSPTAPCTSLRRSFYCWYPSKLSRPSSQCLCSSSSLSSFYPFLYTSLSQSLSWLFVVILFLLLYLVGPFVCYYTSQYHLLLYLPVSSATIPPSIVCYHTSQHELQLTGKGRRSYYVTIDYIRTREMLYHCFFSNWKPRIILEKKLTRGFHSYSSLAKLMRSSTS
ncbi:hypothetical protein XENOCAPTIV_018315 [Xenoophorus captivus]|uniref:Uncharacterized protein n=1 Tax=Xenoophorus captivus TaxID=1517983 RepID=A0ABV0SA82_9TELE